MDCHYEIIECFGGKVWEMGSVVFNDVLQDANVSEILPINIEIKTMR